MNLMSGGMWGVGYVIVEMRTRKLIKRMVATPMRKTDFLLAFVLMRALFLVGELPIILGFASLVFAVPLRGSGEPKTATQPRRMPLRSPTACSSS